VSLTSDDLKRTRQYTENSQRDTYRQATGTLEDYLKGLDMELQWKEFDEIGLSRITQLINKTNQFNLTTRRYTEDEVRALMNDPEAITLQLRLTDRFGDNGMISVIIAKAGPGAAFIIDTWLMSCRVLGRGAEQATLNILAGLAAARGARHLIGRYIPTAKNKMVEDHYGKLGSQPDEAAGDGTAWKLDLDQFTPPETSLQITRLSHD
jgi:FkbH-like protein